MRVQSSDSYVGFRLRLDAMIERAQTRSRTAINEGLAEVFARQEKCAEAARAQADTEWLVRALRNGISS